MVIAAGQLSGAITVTAVQDAIDEANETVLVDIIGVTNGTESGVQQASTAITDDDAVPTVMLSRSSGAILEAAGSSVFTALLSARSGRTVTIDLGFTGAATALVCNAPIPKGVRGAVSPSRTSFLSFFAQDQDPQERIPIARNP